jgi:hypothetical protein
MRINKDLIRTKKKKIENFIKLENLPIGTKYSILYNANILKNRNFLSRIFIKSKDMNKYINTNKAKNFKNAEDLQNDEYLGIGLCNYDYKVEDLKKIFDKLYKFWKNIDKH